MLVILDIETNRLFNPDKLWVICCREISTGVVHTFRDPLSNPEVFLSFAKGVTRWIGHNILTFDYPVLRSFGLLTNVRPEEIFDTLVFSRLLWQSRPGGHSLEAWGQRLKCPKGNFSEFEHFSEEMVSYCEQDTLLNLKLYEHLMTKFPGFENAYKVEHHIQWEAYDQIRTNGFLIDVDSLLTLRDELDTKLAELSSNLREVFPPKSKLIREVCPVETRHGTLHAKDFRWLSGGDLTPYSAGAPFSRFEWKQFNPGSHNDVVEVLNSAGWKPKNKTDGHKEAIDNRDKVKLEHYKIYGWAVDEDNLATLPNDAPEPARALVRWLMLSSRIRKIDEWLEVIDASDRVHTFINGIGTWTHRGSHTTPNVGNIPSIHPKYNPAGPIYPEASSIGARLRQSWLVTPGRILVGTDSTANQLRVLAHYMGDERFTKALLEGNSKLGTDAHSLNKQALGHVCSDRAVAKTFIYAWLLGAGTAKVAEILSCSHGDAKRAIEQFIGYYPGLATLKKDEIPRDARQGYFRGFDGRKVIPYGKDYDEKAYRMLAGYLQNGEAVIMKHAYYKWSKEARKLGIPFWWINWVHDEWQTETIHEPNYTEYDPNTSQWIVSERSLAWQLAKLQRDSIRQVSDEFSLRCPHDGESKFGFNWLETH